MPRRQGWSNLIHDLFIKIEFHGRLLGIVGASFSLVLDFNAFLFLFLALQRECGSSIRINHFWLNIHFIFT